MLKKISNLGTTLKKAEQKSINGGFGDGPFIGSGCYPTQGQCNQALYAAFANGADPRVTSCHPCTTDFGTSGFEVRIGGVL